MRIKYIDVLKAFAIIAVVLYHAGLLTYGYLGVDLFLVVAGYLTTKGLNKKLLVNGDNTEIHPWRAWFIFEIDRISRLLPSLLAVGIVCMLFGAFFMTDDTYESLSQSVIATNLFCNNIVELIASGDYWAPGKAFSPLMHTWYVGLVMQFYLLFPLLYIISRSGKNRLKTLVTLISVCAFISLLVFIGEENVARRFYLLPARFFEFAVGGIAAFLYQPQKDKPFNNWFIYLCYALLLTLMVTNVEMIPANIKLIMVVALTAVLLCSNDTLENKITGNVSFSKIGAASYSIFIWHQPVLAFYRFYYGNRFTVASFTAILIVVAVISFLSYYLLEQKLSKLLKTNKKVFYIGNAIVFVLLNAVTFFVYTRAGVIRDIPELEVKQSVPHRGMWPEYTNRVFKDDKDFETEKTHWFVIGNSFGRDFMNVIYESSIADSVELSYCGAGEYMDPKYEARFAGADKIFIASKGYTDEMVHEIEIFARAFGLSNDDVIVVGEKYYGENINQIFVKRYKDNYDKLSFDIDQNILGKNELSKQTYGCRFIDLLGLTTNSSGRVNVFTDESKLFSYDCTHLTRSGARYYAEKIDWMPFFESKNQK